MEVKRVDGIEQDATAFMAGGGISGALMRSVDWARTPLGPIEVWPASLKTIVGTLLHSRDPMFLWWGPDLIQFYNDATFPASASASIRRPWASAVSTAGRRSGRPSGHRSTTW